MAVALGVPAGCWLFLYRDAGSVSSSDGSVAAAQQTTVRIVRKGALDVEDRITFPAPRKSLVLAIPHRTGVTRHFTPVASRLVVSVAGQHGSSLDALTPGPPVTVHLSAPATKVALHYTVTGAVTRSRPSAPGRALVLVTPMAVGGTRGLPSRLVIVSPGVLNVGCVHGSDELSTCARRNHDGWIVRGQSSGSTSDVVAQVDLGRLVRR